MDQQLDTLEQIASYGVIRPHMKYGRHKPASGDESFRCRVCGAFVHSYSILSGVQNRNHCPFCLWSRHLDLAFAGDRLSACKASMQPIGLAMKPNRNKYGSKQTGELMLIHRCKDCGRLSINRIAADDLEDALLVVLRDSTSLDRATRNKLNTSGIHLLEIQDAMLVTGQLFGNNLK